ncbi:efflux RND transporter permease subunit [Zavarzinia sp. CC-PAN008]|uniref:efflux RND transporter permease subunit n=1 Tax=Zavarzinia sp. CC-PAN008 TaxID=3243332 RepID=UPI003F747C23
MVTFFLGRPVFAIVVAILMVIIGAIAGSTLPVSQYPDITPPQVVVSATYAGASAEVVADSVVTPLEQQINGVDNMLYMSSNSANDGSASITITFKIGTDVDLATVNVQNRVSRATPLLPEVVNRTGVVVQKQQPNIMTVVELNSPDRSRDEVFLANFANLQVVDALKRIPGVGDVQLFGSKLYAIRVWLDPARMAQLGVTPQDVQQAVQDQNVQVAAGKIGQAPSPPGVVFQYQIQAQGRLSKPEEFEKIIVKRGADGQLVRLGDLGRVELGSQSYDASASLDGLPSTAMLVFQTPDANSLQTIARVREAMDAMAPGFPSGISWSNSYDTTKFVAESIREVLKTLGEAMLLVFLVVFVFLQNWRATLIPAIAIPVSLIGTLAVMSLLGFSINTVSMLGMVLAIGLVVDDAIVVVENVSRQLEEGQSPLGAARVAMREVTGPIIATTAVLGAVFVPVAFIPGITGQLYNQFALTIAISVGLSAFNSLTLSPALCVLLLRRGDHEGRGFVFRNFNRGFNAMSRGYEQSIPVITRHWILSSLLFLVLSGLAVVLLLQRPSSFVPQEDDGSFIVQIQLPDGASLAETQKVVDVVREQLQAADGVDHVVALSGLNIMTFTQQSNAALSFVILKPWSERGPGQSAAELVARLQPQFFGIPNAFVFLFNPPSIPGLGQTGGFEYQLQDRAGRGWPAMHAALEDLLGAAAQRPELTQVFTTYSAGVPQYRLEVDREKVETLGLNLPDVFNAMQILLGSLYVNDINLYGRMFRVILQAEADARASATDLSRIHVRDAKGNMVPVDTVARLVPITGPEAISHYNVYPSIAISGAAAPGYSSGQAIAAMEEISRAVLPPGIGFEWTGLTYQEIQAGDLAPFVFALAFVFVFLFLAAQYESWTMPFMILLSVPLAVLGAAAGLTLFGLQLDIFGQIGIVMLIGLAAKNAILIVEFAKRSREEEGRSIVRSAMHAARLRLRPILMTAFAFILGVVPLVLSTGAGAGARRSLGTTVFSGMLSATVLSLFFVPLFYVLIETLRERFGAGRPAETSAGASVSVGVADAEEDRAS